MCISPYLINMEFLNSHTFALGLALVLAQFNRYTLIIATISLVALGAYSIVGITHSYPDISVFTSFVETNQLEAQGFIKNINVSNWIVSILFLILVALYYKTSNIITLTTKKVLYPLYFLFVVALLSSWQGKLIRLSVKLPNYYLAQKKMLIESLKKTDSWKVVQQENHEKYKNYVLVIGESVRKDYMSVYNYPRPTTKYLSSSNGTFINGVYSMAGNTVASLSRTLQLCQTDNCLTTIPENNIISLANKAKLDTYWVSNQGKLGKHETSTSAVALRSKHITFLKQGDQAAENLDDLLLIGQLKKIISNKQSNSKSRLIVLHMLGSHPEVCSRLHSFPINFNLPYGDSINCYLATIDKTDDFISKVINVLSSSNEKYSLIYLSDHGISVTPNRVHHDLSVRNNYQVPLFIINSDDVTHKVINKKFSNRHFIDLFSSWIGVSSNFTDNQYDIFNLEYLPEDKIVSVYNGKGMVDVESMPSEPIVK